MASISDDPNGRRRIQFFNADGKRCTIRLGKIDRKSANTVRERIEKIVGSTICKTSVDDETSRWIAGLSDTMHRKLATAGLVAARGTCQLGQWLDSFIAERSDLKPRTIALYRWTAKSLTDFFGRDRSIREITRNEASHWHNSLTGSGLAIASIRLHVMTTRTLIGAAVKRELVARNPFDHLEGGTTATRNERYLTPAEADRIVDELTSPSAKIVFMLARFAGLRVPSETHLLTWADVDWDRCRLTVRSPKTERHVGHERRSVPITPKLMTRLQAAFDAAPEGETLIVSGYKSNGYLHEHVKAAAERAGVTQWEDIFRLLRSSCEREWALEFPQFAVSKWIGHSITVSGKHYTNGVPDELFQKASQYAAQNRPENVRIQPQQGKTIPVAGNKITTIFRGFPTVADPCGPAARTANSDPSSHRCGGPVCG